jgi:predicted enzyme related to lactoylglutathione lyase
MLAAVEHHGGKVVVPPFTLGGVGRGAYVTDPTGLLIGLHMYDPGA